MKRHSMRVALLAGVCAAGLALSGCDDEADRAEKTPKSGDQTAADKSPATPKAPETAPKRPDAAETERTPAKPNAREADRRQAPAGEATAIRATLKGTDGQDMGSLEIRQQAGGKVVVRYQGKLPEGGHAIHFHAKGACEAPDFKSAGDHWRPANWSAEGANAEIDPGHLGTITAKGDEPVRAEFENAHASLKKDAPNTLFDADGVSVVIHEKPDSNGAKPGEDAGGRIACATIEPAPRN